MNKENVKISIQEENEHEIIVFNRKYGGSLTIKETIKSAKITFQGIDLYYVESNHVYEGEEKIKDRIVTPISYRGFYDEKEFGKILSGLTATPNRRIKMYDPEIVQNFIDNGYQSIYNYVTKVGEKEEAEQERKTFEEKIKDWALNKKIPIEIDHSNHQLFDIKGNLVHIAVIYDYISGGIDESDWDIEKLAKMMMEDERCIVLSKDYEKNMGSMKNGIIDFSKYKAKNFRDAIFEIPYYNQEDGRTESIQFIVKPSKDLFDDLWQEASKDKYPSVRYKEKILKLFLSPYRETECCLSFDKNKIKNKNKP